MELPFPKAILLGLVNKQARPAFSSLQLAQASRRPRDPRKPGASPRGRFRGLPMKRRVIHMCLLLFFLFFFFLGGGMFFFFFLCVFVFGGGGRGV